MKIGYELTEKSAKTIHHGECESGYNVISMSAISGNVMLSVLTVSDSQSLGVNDSDTVIRPTDIYPPSD